LYPAQLRSKPPLCKIERRFFCEKTLDKSVYSVIILII
jgi:hypothetical protein